MGIILYSFWGIVDALFIFEIRETFLWLRYGIFIPASLFFIILFYKKEFYNYKYHYLIASVAILIPSLGAVLIIYLAPNTGDFLHSASLILILIYIFLFLRLLFIHANLVSAIIVTSYEFALLKKKVAFYTLIVNNLYLITALIMIISSAYIIEKYIREIFLNMMQAQNENIDLKNQNKELEKLSMIDPLTKLYNRRYLEIKLQEILLSLKSNHTQERHISFTMMDLDNFKEINDRYGHSFGDKILQDVACIIKSSLRKGDLPFRYGGDEFCIIMFDCEPEMAMVANQRLINNIKDYSKRNNLKVGMSIGCLPLTKDFKDPQQVIEIADILMYKAKQEGGNKVKCIKDINKTSCYKNIKTTTAEQLLV